MSDTMDKLLNSSHGGIKACFDKHDEDIGKLKVSQDNLEDDYKRKRDAKSILKVALSKFLLFWFLFSMGLLINKVINF